MGKSRGMRRRPLGELLRADGLMTDAELDAALSEQGSLGLPLGEIVVTRGYVSRPTLLRALASQRNGDVELEGGFGSGLFDAIDRRSRMTRPGAPVETVHTDLLEH
jgi:hypothetical protein